MTITANHKNNTSQRKDILALVSVLFIFICSFMPWFPGDIIFEDTSLSLYGMLLNMSSLEIDFLDSYNILRMGIAIPISALFLFLWFGLKTVVNKSPLLSLSPPVIIIIFIVFFIISKVEWYWGSIIALILVSGISGYSFRVNGKSQLHASGYTLTYISVCISMGMYHFFLYQQYYRQTDAIYFSDSYGFWISWMMYGILILIPLFKMIFARKFPGFIIGSIILSVFAYHALIYPLFMSGPALFFADNLKTVGTHTVSHIQIVAIALAIAIFLGVPIGIHITRHPKLAGIVLYIASIIITIPSIALFGFMMPILSSIDRAWDAVAGIGIGKVPAIIALALYALLPIIRNTYIAIINVEPGIIEAGRGMGMTNWQLLIKLQLPLSTPVIMAGVRTAVVMSIAIAAIAAYIGAGGLGLFVSEGLQMATNDSVVIGAISMSLLAVIADVFFEKAGRWLTPEGLKVER